MENRPAWEGIDTDTPSVGRDDTFSDRQAQARSLGFGRYKRLKDPVAHFIRDARAII